MKASIQKSTGLMIGSWGYISDEAAYQDALNKGIPASDVELREVTTLEHAALIKARDDLSHPYTVKRATLYPPKEMALDALVKRSSPDPVVQAAGDAQWSEYVNQCFAVKLQFPKV